MNKKGLLTVDNGNSHPHVGIFQNGQLEAIVSFYDFEKYQQEFLNSGHYDILTSSVGEEGELFRHLLQNSIDLSPYKEEHLFLDMPFQYGHGIGDDRLFQGHFIYRHKILSEASINRVALIDSGTFTTVDVVSIEGMEGGFILPGNQLLLESYRRGARLPSLGPSLLRMGESFKLPHQTEDAILESVKGMLIGFFQNFFKSFGPFDQVVLTGGQALEVCSLLRTHLDARIEFEIIPDLIHYSLSNIYNTITSSDFVGPPLQLTPHRKRHLRTVDP